MTTLSQGAFSQNEKVKSSLSKVYKNQIGIQVGYNQGYLKDLNFSPLNYKESGTLYALNYTHQKPKGIFYVDLDFSLGKLKTRASKHFTSSMTLANLEISYVRKLTKKESKYFFHLGGQYSSYLQILDWNDYESFSFLAIHGIGVKGLLSYNINSKHKFNTSLFIPVFQDLVRPPYNGIDETIIENQDNTVKLIFAGKPSSFNTYCSFDWKFNYLYSISNRLDLTATYLARYQNVFEINTVKHLQNQFTVGVNFNF
jgi:hypothetical protein